MNDGTKTGLALDNDIGDTHLSAKGREEDNQFDGIDIMGNDNKCSLLCFNESNSVV